MLIQKDQISSYFGVLKNNNRDKFLLTSKNFKLQFINQHETSRFHCEAIEKHSNLLKPIRLTPAIKA